MSEMTHCANCGTEVPVDRPHQVGECEPPSPRLFTGGEYRLMRGDGTVSDAFALAPDVPLFGICATCGAPRTGAIVATPNGPRDHAIGLQCSVEPSHGPDLP